MGTKRIRSYRILFGFLFALPFFAYCSSTFAETETVHTEDATSDQIQSFSRRFASHEFQRFSFEQTKKIAALTKPLRSEGEFAFVKGKGVLWETHHPSETLLILTPNGISRGTLGGKPVRIEAGGGGIESISRVFLSLFDGNMSSLSGAFYVDLEENPSGWQIVLRPRSSQVAKYLKNIVLHGKDIIESLEINEMNGDSTQVVFHPAEKDANGPRENERILFQD